MSTRVELARLAGLIKAKRREDDIGLRAAASVIGVSASTLSRIERSISENLPDTATLTKIANWLNISVEYMLYKKESSGHKGNIPELSTPEQVEVHLRADKNLSQETAKALSEMFELLYEQMAQE